MPSGASSRVATRNWFALRWPKSRLEPKPRSPRLRSWPRCRHDALKRLGQLCIELRKQFWVHRNFLELVCGRFRLGLSFILDQNRHEQSRGVDETLFGEHLVISINPALLYHPLVHIEHSNDLTQGLL